MSVSLMIKAMMVVAVMGFLIALYSFLHNQGFASGTFCQINESFDCDVVNKGAYSTLFGIPVSLIGLLGYGFIGVAAFLKHRNFTDRSLSVFLLIASTGGMLFSFYLTGLEAFILHAWCLLCLTSQILILILTILSSRLFFLERK